ncbi:MAG: hypothetical protein ACFB20_06350 [Opitutales bacterium]
MPETTEPRWDLLTSEMRVPARETGVWAQLEQATLYLTDQKWCPPIRERFVGYAIPGVLGLYLFAFEEPVNGTEAHLWAVVGDLPSAYFVLDDVPTPVEALDTYCTLMEDWVEAVRSGGDLSEVFPVDAAPTPDNAESLLRRMDFIREEIMPEAPGAPGFDAPFDFSRAK